MWLMNNYDYHKCTIIALHTWSSKHSHSRALRRVKPRNDSCEYVHKVSRMNTYPRKRY